MGTIRLITKFNLTFLLVAGVCLPPLFLTGQLVAATTDQQPATRTTSVEADATSSYADNLLTDYGIPPAVIDVLLANSVLNTGQTPAAAGYTSTTFTVGDVAKLTTVSLAHRTVNASGSVTSTAAPAVADWVGELTAGDGPNGYNILDGMFKQNSDDNQQVTGPTGSLTTKTISVDGHAGTAAFNLLMQIIATAPMAKIVDLTGVTSEISDSTQAQFMMSLFQTSRLPALTELHLGGNNLTNLGTYHLKNTLFSTTSEQRITTLDLSNNQITELSWNDSFGDILTNIKARVLQSS